MWDGSAVPLAENLQIATELLAKCAAAHIVMEMEIGVVGGEEDGVVGEINEKLYSTPEDALATAEALGLGERGRYMLAATFGNVHGVYKPGHVKLRPSILKEIQDAVGAKYGKDKPFDLVFHGGSGSDLEDIREAIGYGVVKMNVDTDTQYAFTRPVAGHMFTNYDGVLKVDGDVGNKKAYDPRTWGKAGEAGMSAGSCMPARTCCLPARSWPEYRLFRPGTRPPGRMRPAGWQLLMPARQDDHMMRENLLGGPPETLLPDHPEARAALAAASDPAEVAARFPELLRGLGRAGRAGDGGRRPGQAYAFARTGYHRGLDQLRRAGWNGHGPVPWEHEPNQGFLRSLHMLGVAAAAIGEDDEATRCEDVPGRQQPGRGRGTRLVGQRPQVNFSAA